MVFTWITLSIIGFILLFWLYKLMCKCFCRSLCVWKNQKDGSMFTREATILSVTKIKPGKKPLLELMLLFENLSGEPIHRKITVWDSKPNLQRFVPDQKIPLALNSAKRPKDPVSLAMGDCRISFAFLLVCSVKIVLYIIGCYIFMGEATQRIFSSPKEFETIFYSSDIWQMALLFIGVVLFMHFLLRKIGVIENGADKFQDWDLLYTGFCAGATVKSFEDTGRLINHNPVVRFSYQFKDRSGKTIVGSDKKIVGKLELGTLQDLETLEIMYLPGNPSVSRIAVNLENNDTFKFVGLLFLLMLLIFSGVIIFTFYQNVF